MRRGNLIGAVLGVLGLLGCLASRGFMTPSGDEPRDLSPSQRVDTGWLLQGLSRPGAQTSRTLSPSIRGTVMGPRGPVAGVEVRATRAVPGESLSSRPCEDAIGEDTRFSLFTCPEPERLSELVAQRQGEVPVLARATSAGDGSFALEGLEAGTYALWAQSDEGTGLWQDIEAGRQDLELRLGAGVRLSGTISGEGGEPIPGALVTAIFTAHSRFFEAVADGTGHFSLGPLPRGDYEVLISSKGWLTRQWSMTAYRSRMDHDVVLDRPRRVSGRVTLEGSPVARARVIAELSPMVPREVFTDATGHFSLEGLSPRRSYQLIATHEQLGARVQVSFHVPGGSRFQVLAQLPDFSLELMPVAQVRGHVLDAARRPLAGARVLLHANTDDGPRLVTSTRTDAEGRYALGPMKPGPLSFEVRVPGWRLPEEDTWSDFPAGTTTREFILSPLSPVEGLLVDATGQPLADARLSLSSPDHSIQTSGESGTDGHFRLEVPTPGAYHLSIDDGRVHEASRTHEVIAPASLHLVVSLRPHVSGELVDDTGMPVPNAEVSLWSDAPRANTSQLTYGRTDARGRFSLPAPSPGHYLLSAQFQQEGVLHSTSQRVELGEGETLAHLRFEQGHVLSGVVVDGRGQPREGVDVLLLSSRHVLQRSSCGGGPDWSEHTGPDGRFSFQAVSGESLELMVYDAGYRLRAQGPGVPQDTLPLEPGARDVRVVLVREAEVYGRLVRTDGSPITRYRVNGEPYANESGEFSWPISGTGPLQLEFSAPELLPDSAPVRRSVPVQEEVDQDLGEIVLGDP